jgi:hypothetical protein
MEESPIRHVLSPLFWQLPLLYTKISVVQIIKIPDAKIADVILGALNE